MKKYEQSFCITRSFGMLKKLVSNKGTHKITLLIHLHIYNKVSSKDNRVLFKYTRICDQQTEKIYFNRHIKSTK